MESVLSQLAMFMPWMENLTRFLSLGHSSIIADRVDGLKEVFQFMRQQIDERAKSWVKGQPRDITDAYLDKIEETTDVNSSFHKSRTPKILNKQFCQIILKAPNFLVFPIFRSSTREFHAGSVWWGDRYNFLFLGLASRLHGPASFSSEETPDRN